MCGIAGFVITDGSLCRSRAPEVLRRMCDSLQPRGPDDQGIWFSDEAPETAAPLVGLGHRRLSVIDVSAAGRQPMSNEDRSVWLTYNGEIYNFSELRQELQSRGHLFRSRTDTEVIVHAYEEWGERCPEKFNGMFAFALWDSRCRKLFLARDRLGKKPLYYALAGGIVFGSEPKALLCLPDFDRSIDMLSLQKYLLFEYVPSPHTIYRRIKRLEAGYSAVWQDGQLRQQRYWNIRFPESRQPASAERLQFLLQDAVQRRLVSDVPLGVFLSGGIDSSTVASFAAAGSAEQLQTFTIGFSDPSFDESESARRSAAFFKTNHRHERLSAAVTQDLLTEIVDFLDEPFADASIVPTYLLSRFTRRHVTVALSGDGGDELFAGYPTFPAARLARMFERLPAAAQRLFCALVRALPVNRNNLSLDFMLKQFVRGMPYSLALRNQVWIGAFAPPEQSRLVAGAAAAAQISEDLAAQAAECGAVDDIDVLQYLYLKFYLSDDILVKVDRASMANSLEVRAPLLDYRLVEAAVALPPQEKMPGLAMKAVLKKIMRRRLPAEVLQRPKKGFGIPVAKWLRQDLRALVTDVLSPENVRRQNLFQPESVQRVLAEHLRGTRDNRKQLWTLMMASLWYDRWARVPPATEAGSDADRDYHA
ncbi:MAG: asparagine synthase (glutamine-hydrolyzing) [Candidatus Omnitrophica bacterium]|nr:asparagine synthase (glutamine-hydrolyzing) [Candidatus Omnitrophota bacterium]